jgi:asparagine synthase (glutamine-hydrolysing)
MYRPKMGFAVPLARWFRGPLRQRVRDSLLDGRLAESGWFEQATIRRMVDQHESGVRDHSTPLWTLLMYEAFMRLAQGDAGARPVSWSA